MSFLDGLGTSMDDLEIFSLHLAATVEDHTFFQDEDRGDDVARNASRSPDLHTLSSREVPRYLSA